MFFDENLLLYNNAGKALYAVPDESSFLKKEKERKLKKDKIRNSSEEDITTTIGDILKAKGITI